MKLLDRKIKHHDYIFEGEELINKEEEDYHNFNLKYLERKWKSLFLMMKTFLMMRREN